jgi:hypothetical protein
LVCFGEEDEEDEEEEGALGVPAEESRRRRRRTAVMVAAARATRTSFRRGAPVSISHAHGEAAAFAAVCSRPPS